MKTLIIIAITLMLIVSGCASKDTEVTKIGIIAATTGPAAFIGTPQVQGARLAVNELDNFELIVEDSPCDPKQAVSAFTKLVNIDKVDYVIGPSCSFENMAVAPLAEANRIPTIALGAQTELSDVGEFTIPFNENPSQQGKTLGDYMAKQGYERGGAIYFVAPYTIQVAEGFREGFETNGKQFVLNEQITDFGRSDFKDLIAKAISKDVDAIYVDSFGQEETVIRQFTELGFKGKIVFAENGFRKDVADNDNAQEMVVVAYQDISGGLYSEFHKKFIDEYKEEPIQPYGAALAYDAVHKIAESTDIERSQLKSVILSKQHIGASGILNYDNGQPIREFLVYTVEDNSFVQQN